MNPSRYALQGAGGVSLWEAAEGARRAFREPLDPEARALARFRAQHVGDPQAFSRTAPGEALFGVLVTNLATKGARLMTCRGEPRRAWRGTWAQAERVIERSAHIFGGMHVCNVVEIVDEPEAGQ